MPYPDSQYERSWKMQTKGVTLYPVTPQGHTPGPWAYDADSREVFSTDEDHGCGWIALVKGNDTNDLPLSEGMRLANARLIAAAPSLLAALHEIADECARRLRKGEDSGDRATLRLCREAIAKAEGKEVPNG